MTVTVCWSVKGGSGATVVAACLALANPAPMLLVDLDGDLPAALGVPDPAGQALADWFATDLPAAALEDLAVELDPTTRLVARGAAPIPGDAARWPDLADWLVSSPFDVVVDAGTGPPPPALASASAGVRMTLVTRACYLALRRATLVGPRPDAIVLVAEPGRALRSTDVEHSLGAPVVATVTVDPAVFRAVDAGLLLARLPGMIGRELKAKPRRMRLVR